VNSFFTVLIKTQWIIAYQCAVIIEDCCFPSGGDASNETADVSASGRSLDLCYLADGVLLLSTTCHLSETAALWIHVWNWSYSFLFIV